MCIGIHTLFQVGDSPANPVVVEEMDVEVEEPYEMTSEKAFTFLLHDMQRMTKFPDMSQFDEFMLSCERYIEANPLHYEPPFSSDVSMHTFTLWDARERWVIGKPYPDLEPEVGRVMKNGAGSPFYEEGYHVCFSKLDFPFDADLWDNNFHCKHYSIESFNKNWRVITLNTAVSWWFASLGQDSLTGELQPRLELNSADFDAKWAGFHYLLISEHFAIE